MGSGFPPTIQRHEHYRLIDDSKIAHGCEYECVFLVRLSSVYPGLALCQLWLAPAPWDPAQINNGWIVALLCSVTTFTLKGQVSLR